MKSPEEATAAASPGLLGAACPVPRSRYQHVLLGHGGGGSLSQSLLRDIFLPAFTGGRTGIMEDQATLRLDAAAPRIAFTTDAFVVKPLFFPGGDIGRLAVHGTVNDLAVGGARPLYLSAAFILEEGLPLADLQRIAASMQQACEESGVRLVTGDTKVVDRGKGDGVFIVTTGVGVVPEGRSLSIASARPGDRVILSGTIGDHGVAIMSLRNGIEFETAVESDTAPLIALTELMLGCCPAIRCMRDPTRGGVSSTLNELAEASKVGVSIDEAALPIRDEVRGACETLGLDPLYVANEGKLIAVAPAEDAERLVRRMRGHPLGRDAAIIGEITAKHPGRVVQRSVVGGERVVTMLSGEQLPRIC